MRAVKAVVSQSGYAGSSEPLLTVPVLSTAGPYPGKYSLKDKSSAGPIVRPNKKIPVFRITQPYLNLLVKPRLLSGFKEKI